MKYFTDPIKKKHLRFKKLANVSFNLNNINLRIKSYPDDKYLKILKQDQTDIYIITKFFDSIDQNGNLLSLYTPELTGLRTDNSKNFVMIQNDDIITFHFKIKYPVKERYINIPRLFDHNHFYIPIRAYFNNTSAPIFTDQFGQLYVPPKINNDATLKIDYSVIKTDAIGVNYFSKAKFLSGPNNVLFYPKKNYQSLDMELPDYFESTITKFKDDDNNIKKIIFSNLNKRGFVWTRNNFEKLFKSKKLNKYGYCMLFFITALKLRIPALFCLGYNGIRIDRNFKEGHLNELEQCPFIMLYHNDKTRIIEGQEEYFQELRSSKSKKYPVPKKIELIEINRYKEEYSRYKSYLRKNFSNVYQFNFEIIYPKLKIDGYTQDFHNFSIEGRYEKCSEVLKYLYKLFIQKFKLYYYILEEINMKVSKINNNDGNFFKSLKVLIKKIYLTHYNLLYNDDKEMDKTTLVMDFIYLVVLKTIKSSSYQFDIFINYKNGDLKKIVRNGEKIKKEKIYDEFNNLAENFKLVVDEHVGYVINAIEESEDFDIFLKKIVERYDFILEIINNIDSYKKQLIEEIFNGDVLLLRFKNG